jgi:hypothetical protein
MPDRSSAQRVMNLFVVRCLLRTARQPRKRTLFHQEIADTEEITAIKAIMDITDIKIIKALTDTMVP